MNTLTNSFKPSHQSTPIRANKTETNCKTLGKYLTSIFSLSNVNNIVFKIELIALNWILESEQKLGSTLQSKISKSFLKSTHYTEKTEKTSRVAVYSLQ